MVGEKSQYQLLEEIIEGFLEIGVNSGATINSFGRERSSTNRKEEVWDSIDQRIKLYIGKKYPHTMEGSSPVSKASSVASQLTRKCMKTYQGSESLEGFEAEMKRFREKTGEEALSRVLEVGVNYLEGEADREAVENLSRQIQRAAD